MRIADLYYRRRRTLWRCDDWNSLVATRGEIARRCSTRAGCRTLWRPSNRGRRLRRWRRC